MSVLTVCDLKLGLGHDAACYSEGLADVVARVGALHRWNGQLSIHGHRNAAISLRWLVGEQKVLQGARERDAMWKQCSTLERPRTLQSITWRPHSTCFFLIDILSTLNVLTSSNLFIVPSLLWLEKVKIFVSTTNVIVATKSFIRIVHFESFIGGNQDI